MKNIFMLIALIISMSLSTQPADLFAGVQEHETTEMNDSLPENAEEVGFAYINADMDFFSYLPGNGWYTEEYNDMIIFYNDYSLDPSSSIAVSSYVYPVDENQRASQSQYYIEMAQSNLEYIIEDITVVKMDNYIFGNNSAYWYYYTGKLVSNGSEVAGEYMYWWVDDMEYTCSMYCSNEEYDFFSYAMHSMIDNFGQPSKME
ncbi:MAG: hypothetical protein JXN65_09485 [Clostridia bacterium]|nr:hypothetical protein [Clostridia bacterium]